MSTASAPPIRLGAVEWALLFALSLIWGGSFLFGRLIVRDIPPLTAAAGRVSIAAAILALVVVAQRGSFPKGFAGWRPYLVMGFINNVVPFTLILWGQKSVGVGLAAVLNATTPLFGGLVAHLATDEKLRANRLAGVMVGIAGVAILVGPGAVTAIGTHTLAELALIGAALSYGVAGIYGRRFRTAPPLTSATCQLTSSTAMLLPLAALVDRPWALPMPGSAAIASLIALALLSTAIGYILFFTIIRRAGGSNVMLVTLMIPPSAILLGALVLGETMELGQFAGAVVIGLALILIDGRALRVFGREAGAR
ncbi:MAG: DMT family transporter [Hyphomicrobiaceae bacterium]